MIYSAKLGLYWEACTAVLIHREVFGAIRNQRKIVLDGDSSDGGIGNVQGLALSGRAVELEVTARRLWSVAFR